MNRIDFIAIDFETATYLRNSICEIGITIVKNGSIVDSKSWLVQPPCNNYDSINTHIHGITPEDTKEAPLFPDVWKEVLPVINNQIVVAHNTGFDMYALRDALLLYDLPLPSFNFYCSYRISKYIYKNCHSYSLPIICNHTGIELTKHHRAKDDSEACAKLFLKCLSEIGNTSIEGLQDLYNFKQGKFTESSFRPQHQMTNSFTKKSISKIIGDPNKIEEGSLFYSKTVCFTGACSFGVRSELLQKIADIGGFPVDSVTKSTDYLVVGQQDYRVVGESGMSSNQKKAFDLKSKGVDI